jgi:hypothetical protein
MEQLCGWKYLGCRDKVAGNGTLQLSGWNIYDLATERLEYL